MKIEILFCSLDFLRNFKYISDFFYAILLLEGGFTMLRVQKISLILIVFGLAIEILMVNDVLAIFADIFALFSIDLHGPFFNSIAFRSIGALIGGAFLLFGMFLYKKYDNEKD